MSNPYSSPTADLSAGSFDSDTYEPSMFALKGRIGRVRYLAYSIGLSLLFGLLISMVAGILLATQSSNSKSVLAVVTMVAYVPAFAISIIMAIRRLNDMDNTGWLSILSLVPLVNFFFFLWLIFAPGTSGTNRYGVVPSKNSRGAIAAACIILAVAVIGIVAAIVIPVFQSQGTQANAAKAEQVAPAPVEIAAE